MDVALLLALPAGVRVSAISQEGEIVVVMAFTEQPAARCPVCDHVSMAIHSRYQRTLRDLRCGGHSVCLFLTVRKFFCQNPACLRRIFTERLPALMRPSAQMTCRLQAALQAIGLATSGSLDARLAHRLGSHTSWMTILRRITDLGVPTSLPVTVLGIDDFALRRGHRYGTILVDLTSHRIIDLLPERAVQSAATWMQQHPELRVVSRDRGQDYTQAIVLGAPQALAVADRFHLFKNLIESCEPVVGRCWKELRQVHPALPPLHLPQAREWRPAKGQQEAERQLHTKAPKQDHYDLVHQLRARGIPDREIAERLHIPRRTISRWMGMTHCPNSQGHRKHPSKFDPYARHILTRWKTGCRDVSLLWAEIRLQGFTGSVRTVYRFIRTLRQHASDLPEPSVLDRLSLQACLWLIACRESGWEPPRRSTWKWCARRVPPWQRCIPSSNHLAISCATVKGSDWPSGNRRSPSAESRRFSGLSKAWTGMREQLPQRSPFLTATDRSRGL